MKSNILTRDITVNRFRRKRGAALSAKIQDIANNQGRALEILDVGGRPDYWQNVSAQGIEKIVLLNVLPTELSRARDDRIAFEDRVGNGCDLTDYANKSVDLVHSNSVIEHVGNWSAMQAMAAEAMRVGKRGWVQTPAWEFPVEPHFRLPFVHWFGRAAQAMMLRVRYGHVSRGRRRSMVDSINLVSRGEFKELFPNARITTERVFGLPKSYIAQW